MTTVRQFGNFVTVTKQLIMYFEIRIQNYMPHMRFQERPYISQYEYQVVYHPPLRSVFFFASKFDNVDNGIQRKFS